MGTCDHPAIRTERYAEDPTPILECSEEFSCVHIPQTNGFVMTSSSDSPSVRAKRHGT